ncbi:hypothetical protein TNIN_439551 [Trichonephila inaurata madagascariensis]|uniref:Uncharacterized protein n=1 Tax=Trichonephila inaurata madagascariensis TaxID=2747483 RepID=A0A8X6YBV9_9ARAC|nr:hypothetical protein TNIN_439551 [Trichonephila inaurata madagascariensis]
MHKFSAEEERLDHIKQAESYITSREKKSPMPPTTDRSSKAFSFTGIVRGMRREVEEDAPANQMPLSRD